MGNRWESIIVALALIFLFYFIRKYSLRKRPPFISQSTHANLEKNRGKQLQTRGKKADKVPSVNPPLTSNHVASLVMHPHSLERAEKEFVQNAPRFRGSYESLFMTCNGKVTGVFREQVLGHWEEGIQATEAQYFILVWTTIIQKHCGRNYYQNRVSRKNRDTQVENDILQDWLKQLFKWGLQREIHGQIHSTELEGEPLSNAGTERPRWIIDGVVLEEGEEHVKLIGH